MTKTEKLIRALRATYATHPAIVEAADEIERLHSALTVADRHFTGTFSENGTDHQIIRRALADTAIEPDLDAPYIPTLVKFDEPPRLEYVTKDCVCIYNPVDERFCYITDMETRKIIGFQFMLPRKPEPTSERIEFSLEGTGFTLRECGCTEGFCESRADGTCALSSGVSDMTKNRKEGHEKPESQEPAHQA